MQIVPFPAYYQSVYTNFDISSFSLISCIAIRRLLETKRACIVIVVVGKVMTYQEAL